MQNSSPIKGIKRMPNKQFKLPVQDSIKIIDEVRKIQKYNKSIRPDEDRKQYKLLLQWVNTKLQATKQLICVKNEKMKQAQTQIQVQQNETIEQQIQIQQRKIIQSLMIQMIDMFKKQCKEKAQLMEVCFQYFNQLIILYAKHYEKQFLQTIKLYNISLSQVQDQYGQKLAECNKKISYLESQKQTKWKNIYMLAKDNRILRRQKGKLLRSIQEQDQKLKILQQQLCQVAKQNELNKLIIRFENDSQNLKVFMKNRLALMKFQKIIQKYPKKAMKVLNNDLLKLQIQQLNSLDSKIDYIRRVITQSGDVFDQYEDLNQMINKPNKMVFNMYSQTDAQDIEPPKQFRQIGVNYELQNTIRFFDHWQQIYEVKITGFPELKEKYVCFRNPNRKLTNKVVKKKPYDNQKKEFFVMQICQREVYQVLNIKIKKRGNQFSNNHTIGVTYNPKLKTKLKLYFNNINDPKINSIFQDSFEIQENDLIFRQTMPSKIKKIATSKGLNSFRKSQTLAGNGKYALNKINGKKPFISKRNSQALSFQNNFSESKDIENETIDQKSQFQSSNKSQQIEQRQKDQKQLNLGLNQNYIQKFNKKSKRMTRRTVTEMSPVGLQKNSVMPKLSIFAEQISNKTTQRKQNISEKIESQSQSQRLSTEGISKNRRKTKNSINMGKMNRVKTSQNARNSKSQSKHKAMDFIQEQQQQNQDSPGFNSTGLEWNKIKQNSRLSCKQPNSSFKKSKLYDSSNNLGSIKQNYISEIEGILAQRNQKYHLTMNPNSSLGNKNVQRLSARNSSFNLSRFKSRQSVINIDTCSMNSHGSSNNQSTFNYKKYINESKPQQIYEAIESDNLNPIYIKPFEVKKLAEKIIKSMYTRRKQLLSGNSSITLKIFIQHYLKQIYGINWKGDKNILRYPYTIQDRQTSSNLKIFTIMLNYNLHAQYLQDLFRLYLTMLQKNQYCGSQNPLVASKTKGNSIMKYLLSIYFEQITANDIQLNLPFMNQYQIDLNQVFMVVENQLRKYTVQTQVYNFLLKLLPENQTNIDFSQLKEILFIFKNEQEKYLAHIARLKYFFKTNGKNIAQQQNSKPQNAGNKIQSGSKGRVSNSDKQNFGGNNLTGNQKGGSSKQQSKGDMEILPIHRVCLYLKRYQWTDLLEINTYVEQKYHKIIGVFIQEEAIKFITKYCCIISERMSGKKLVNHNGMLSISIPAQPNSHTYSTSHPLSWLLQRGKQLIRNYYRYKTPLDRYFLMFLHISILAYQLEIGVNEVLNDSLNFLNIEYKKLKTRQEVDVFMKE